jgi:alpha,alpha-trehalase
VSNDQPDSDGHPEGPTHLARPEGRLVALRPPAGVAPFPAGTDPGPAAVLGVPAPAGLESIFPPIADYAFLSDCENTCLVAPTGSVEWLCLPKPHDPSVFGTLLDRAAGSLRLAPADTAVPANRRYVPGTMVLATTWQTRTGWLAVRDCLTVAPWHRTNDRSSLHRRTPSDFDARHLLVRKATCLHGTVDVVLDCEPSFDYGRTDASWEYTGPSYDQVATTNPDFLRLTLAGDLRMGIEGRAVRARHRLTAGESCYVALGWSDRPPPVDLADVDACVADTSRFWRGWIDGGRFPDHPWREHLQRSALTLKGLTYASTGALLAAPTTSLPEYLGGERNWDYRYTWIRDASFTLWSLHALGFDAEADDFLAFLGDVLEPRTTGDTGSAEPELQVLYGVDGESVLTESTLDHLSGYGGSQPVRVGNAAYRQEQFDILGAIVDCVYQHTRSRDSLTERAWRIVVRAVEAALRDWRQPDHSIWETRGEARHFTFSKVMCWVAVDRGARLAALRGEQDRADRWWSAALEIHADVCANGVDDKGRFTQSYGSDQLDASLLLLPLVRFLSPEDERLRATVLAIADELDDNGFVRRYQTATTDDGLDEPEASFTVCSFWLVSALVEIGEVDRGRKLCERLLGSATTLDLYGEELDAATGRHLGNFPQALTHLSLVNAVLHVIEAERGATDGAAGPAASSTWWTAAGRDERPEAKAV